MKFATKAIHSSYDCDEHNRALMPPIYQNSMFALHEIGEQVPYRYSRLSNPTRQVLEDTVADLEHGAAGFAFSSGMAGIDAVWRTFLRPGDTIVAVADIYGGAYDLLVDVYKEWGVNVVFADLGNPNRLDELLAAHKVKLVWLETPSNPLLRLGGLPKTQPPQRLAFRTNCRKHPFFPLVCRTNRRRCRHFLRQQRLRRRQTSRVRTNRRRHHA